jgi:4-hydroxy-tetrahydrodipicolinate synthase
MSLSAPRFGRVSTAMVTPFDESGALDLDQAAALARHLVANGSDGLVVAGTTGEAPVLTDVERLALIEAVSQSVSVPVLAGTTTNDTEHSVGLTRQAASLGAAGVLAVTPYYNRPSQAGLLGHFSAVAEATSLPVVLYDIPLRTGRKILASTVLSLVERQANVVGVKEASGDLAGAAELIAAAPPSFEVYSGDDVLTLPLMSIGAVGVISVASHWIGTELRECLEAFVAGDPCRATELNQALLSSFRFEGSDRWPNPLPSKAILRAQGLKVGQCRWPMGPADDELEAAAAALLRELGVLRG